MARQIESGRTVAIFPEGALSPLGGFRRPHSGLARVALRTGAPVIPVGIGLQHDRIRITETDMDGERVTGHLYASGPYAMTVGRPLYFEGDAQDRERVSAATTQIMNHIRYLAYESQNRIQLSPAAEVNPHPTLDFPVGIH
jgi:1-acyl-sn-glycerol-3-phosphate acyltransferase